MSKIFYIFILFFLGGIVFSQSYTDFTLKEKNLIGTQSDKMMRVLQKTNFQDSIILKSNSIDINPTDIYTKILYERMLQSVKDPDNKGVGIAAPQVGINRRLIIVQRFDKIDKNFEVFINPKIIWQSQLLQSGMEGDLSFEGRNNIKRNYSIQVQYNNLQGEQKTEILEGFTAVIFQRERDHLDGKLLIDRYKEQEYIKYKSKEFYTEIVE